MPLFSQISIIGVGLIGGSLAKTIRKKIITKKIIGFFRSKEKLNKALRDKIVDSGFLDLKQSIQNSDLIILALPVSEIIKFMFRIKRILRTDALIIDVGSTKNKIVSVADRLNLNFVGTHPLAGSEKKGFAFSLDTLFNNSLVIITPTKKTDKKASRKVKLFWRKMNAKVIALSPQQHDKILSFTSHLPHLVAFSLINSVPHTYLKFGASGLKDTTRIALSETNIWSDIFLSNKKELLNSLNAFRRQIEKLENVIENDRRDSLIRLLNISKSKREKIA